MGFDRVHFVNGLFGFGRLDFLVGPMAIQSDLLIPDRWRSLHLWKGSLNHPKRVTWNHQESNPNRTTTEIPLHSRYVFLRAKATEFSAKAASELSVRAQQTATELSAKVNGAGGSTVVTENSRRFQGGFGGAGCEQLMWPLMTFQMAVWLWLQHRLNTQKCMISPFPISPAPFFLVSFMIIHQQASLSFLILMGGRWFCFFFDRSSRWAQEPKYKWKVMWPL